MENRSCGQQVSASTIAACPLCSEAASSPLFELWSDSSSVAYLSEERAVGGHTVLALRRHVEHLSQLTQQEQSSFFGAMTRLERALLDVVACDRVLLMKLGLAVPHLHIHFYPVARSTTRDEVVAVMERRTRVEIDAANMRELADELRTRLS